MLVLFVAATENVVKLPFVLSVTITALPLALAVKPTGKVVWQLAV